MREHETTVTITVWWSDGTEIGGSGFVLAKGWHWEVKSGPYTSSAWAPTEKSAWLSVSNDLARRP